MVYLGPDETNEGESEKERRVDWKQMLSLSRSLCPFFPLSLSFRCSFLFSLLIHIHSFRVQTRSKYLWILTPYRHIKAPWMGRIYTKYEPNLTCVTETAKYKHTQAGTQISELPRATKLP